MTQSPKLSVALPPAHYRQRLDGIRTYLVGQGLDGILLLNAYHIMWATGFFHIPNERPLGLYIAADQEEPIFYAPLLEREHVEELGIGTVQCYWEFPGEVPAQVWMLQQIREERVAIDDISVRLSGAMRAVKPQLTLDDGIAQMRYFKTAAEIDLTELAAGYADHALSVARRAMADGVKRGITEIEVVRIVQSETTAKMQAELDTLTNFYRGAVSLTVHTGARGALPHGQPGPHVIKPGHTVIVGVGAKVGGFHAESGCTFVIGDPTPDQLACLEATWACDEAALAALKPGATCESVNDAGLAVLRERGYGDFIRHRIGHGMGVEGHEAPWLSVGDQTLLQPTWVFSNEPGIYRPGMDGYRIIDSMVVTESGGRRLSRYLSEHGPGDRVIG